MTEQSELMLADAAARQRIVDDLDRTIFVEAGAGTGKTSVLVARIVNLITAGRVTVDHLVAITFTEAAAAELRDRIREALERAASDSQRSEGPFGSPGEQRERCRQAAMAIDQAVISTIHAFAGHLLRTYPLEAGLPPGFATLDEIRQAVHFEERFKQWFWRDALQEPLRTVLKRSLLLGLTRDTIRGLAAALEEQHDLLASQTTWDAPATELNPALPLAHKVGRTLLGLQRGLRFAHDPERDPLVQAILGAQSSARQMLAAQTEDDALSALLGLGRLESDVEVDAWDAVADGQNAGLVASERLERINALVSALLDAHRTAALASLLGCLRDFVLTGVRRRRADGVATFHDLLAWARDLLRDHPSVRHAAQARYQRIFIDEFQDTDPLQAEIAFYLAADEQQGQPLPSDWREAPLTPGKLFVVGDPKQSIYRFRGADIAIYDDLLQRLQDCRERLTHNFRSVRPVLDWVNHHFEEHMRAAPGFQPEYTPLAAQWSAEDDAPSGVRRVGSLIDGSADDAAEAEALSFAALARSAVQDGWLVSDRDASGARRMRPASFRDICILLPARTHLRRLERALERSAVPYRVEAGKLVLATQEVRDLLACLRSIEDPSDQVALVAALRSPAYACSDVDLLQWVEGGGRLDHEHPGDGPDGSVKAALANLADFHHRRFLLSPAALIETFMAERLLLASAFAEARPREAWRRLRYVVSRARAFTSTGRHTLRAFLDWIEGLQRTAVRDPEAGSAESDEDAIHIQTIHSAKGLEYPIVLLGGLGSTGRGRMYGTQVIANRRTNRLACRVGRNWQTLDFAAAVRRETQMADAEAVRLLYVAATRARDHLVLSLFRGSRAASSAAAAIERRLAASSTEICPPVAVPVPGEPEVVQPPAVELEDIAAEVSLEESWQSARHERVLASAAPLAHATWWTAERAQGAANPPAIELPPGTPWRRNVSLLARVDGALVEVTVDFVYRLPDGYVLAVRAETDADLAQRAFQAATGQVVLSTHIC